MINKSKLVLGLATASLTIAAATLAPQAQAHQKAKKHTHTHHHAMTTYSSSSSTERMAEAANNKVEALEAQVQAMQYELQALRSEARRPVTTADSVKVQELDQWMASMKSEPSRKSGSKDNMVFFRGGYGHADSMRGGTIPNAGVLDVGGGELSAGAPLALGAIAGDYAGARAGQDAWYFGAGFDFSLNDNFFGLMNGTEVFAELMFDYKEFAQNMANSPLSSTAANNAVALVPVAGVGANGLATVNQLTLAASPKIKLFKGSAFRPWLIPIGFELSVISPPSDAITVLNPGLQFGLGADYKIWKDLYVGADARYHYAADTIDGVNTNGVTAGGYLGIGF